MGNLKSCYPTKKSEQTNSPERKYKRNLSATFNVSSPSNTNDKLISQCVDVNTATEEQLMTLNGINRTIARHIIEHRRQLPGCKFQKIEDIALVSGIGATKFSNIKDEIVIKKSENGRDSQPYRTSLNTGTLEEFLKVPLLNEELAKNILNYRQKHKFLSVRELLNVEGFNNELFNCISHSFTIHESNNKPPIPVRPNLNNITDSVSSNTSLSKSIENLIQLISPILKKTKRREVHDEISYEFLTKNRPSVRIATWNLERFSSSKSENPGVIEVICLTLLERRISVLCVQEIADVNALENICNELNKPSLKNIQNFQYNSMQWKCITSTASGRMYQANEHLGVLYDSSRNIDILESSLVDLDDSGDKKLFVRRPFIVSLRINKFDLFIVIVHLKAVSHDGTGTNRNEAEASRTAYLLNCLEKFLSNEKDLILLGDFNLESSAEQFDILRNKNYIPLVAADVFTNISTKNYKGSRSYDNIWIGEQTQKSFTGNVEVIRSGLTHVLIPNDWSFGGMVSDHCPVFAEFFTDIDYDENVIEQFEKTISDFHIGDSD